LGKEGHTDQFNFFGGKRELTDKDAEETAAREVNEESNGLIDFQSLLSLLRNQNERKLIWYKFGKYVLFLLNLDSTQVRNSLGDLSDLPKKFDSMQTRGPHCEMSIVKWHDLRDLLPRYKVVSKQQQQQQQQEDEMKRDESKNGAASNETPPTSPSKLESQQQQNNNNNQSIDERSLLLKKAVRYDLFQNFFYPNEFPITASNSNTNANTNSVETNTNDNPKSEK